MTYQQIIECAAEELKMPKEYIESVYSSFWKFIRETIKSLPLKENITEEQFDELRTNFNIPSLGKLYCTKDRFLRQRKRMQYIRKIKENDKSKEH